MMHHKKCYLCDEKNKFYEPNEAAEKEDEEQMSQFKKAEAEASKEEAKDESKIDEETKNAVPEIKYEVPWTCIQCEWETKHDPHICFYCKLDRRMFEDVSSGAASY